MPLNFIRAVLHSFTACLAVGTAFAQTPVTVSFSDLIQVYDGTAKFPTAFTSPGGLDVLLTMTPRTSETIYRTAPSTLDLSHSSTPLGSYKAIGDIIRVAGTNRMLESIDVIFSSWSKASDWPVLAAQNPNGYVHPVTAIVYRRNSNGSLTLLDQKSQNILVPWRPATLGDGTPYPYGGHSFVSRFNFPTGTTLSQEIAVLVGFDTQTGGFNPTNTEGPYNSLNIALGTANPTIGTNFETTTMVRYSSSPLLTTAYGTHTPLIEVRAFPSSPPTGVPVNAGHYIIKGDVVSTGYTGSTTVDFTISKAPAQISLSNLVQAATGSPKSVQVSTTPSALSHSVLYNGQTSAPSAIGPYPVIATINAPNHYGSTSGTLILGKTLATYLQPWVNTGLTPSTAAGDPDRDGLSNLLEYAIGSNPSSGMIPVPPLSIKPRGNQMILGFRRQASSIDLTYQIQSSPNLQSPLGWSPITGPMEVVDTVDGVEQVEVAIDASVATGRFFRLHVSRNGNY